MTDEKKTMTEAEFMAERAAAQQQLMQLCGAEVLRSLASPDMLPNTLVNLRVKTELLAIDVNTIIAALLSQDLLNQHTFMMTSLRLMQQRVEGLAAEQGSASKIVVARGKLS